MSSTTRRQFAKTLTAAGAAVAAADLVAQEEKKPEPNAFGLALAGLVRAQFGQHLSEDEMAQVTKDFQDYAPFIEGFRKFELKNADEPDFTFQALADRW